MAISKALFTVFKQYAELDTSRADGAHYEAVIALFEPLLQSAGFQAERLPIPETVAGGLNRVNLIARRTVDPKLPTLLIYNHIDVVPATYSDAFTFREENGHIYVRGAADHKGSTIAVIDALQKLHATKVKLRYNVFFLLTTDEETSQLPQLEFLTDHLQLDPKHTFCYDPDTFAGGITTSHLGIYQCKLVSHGKAVHSGMSHLGVNALENLLALWPTIQSLKTHYSQKVSAILSFPKDGKSETVRSSMNATVISAGTAPNIIPDTSELQLDIRFAPELVVQTEREFVRKQLETAIHASGVDIEVQDGEVFEGYACSHPEIDRFEATLQSVSGENGQYCVMGSTPVASWTKQLGIPHFGLGVGRYDSNMHGNNERCAIKDMETVSQVIEKFLHYSD